MNFIYLFNIIIIINKRTKNKNGSCMFNISLQRERKEILSDHNDLKMKTSGCLRKKIDITQLEDYFNLYTYTYEESRNKENRFTFIFIFIFINKWSERESTSLRADELFLLS